jgi:hypothetical protein
MPTGYTCKVQDGSILTLRDFAMLCVRAMGVCITLRDSDNAEIPERFEPRTSYHDDALAKARALWAEVDALTPEECDARAAAEHEAAVAQLDRWRAETEVHEGRYTAMLEKVRAWNPGGELAGLRSFMSQQLEESIKFDCGRSYGDPPKRLTGQEWREKTIDRCHRDIGYHAGEREKEIERVESRNRYLAALRAALETA